MTAPTDNAAVERLSPENAALVDRVLGLPRVTTIGGDCSIMTWTTLAKLLDAARAEGALPPAPPSREEIVKVLDAHVAGTRRDLFAIASDLLSLFAGGGER